MPVRVLIADDDPALRAVLAELIVAAPSVQLVGCVDDAEGATTLAARTHPDVAIVDVRMPGGGPVATRRILAASPATRIIAHSAYDDDASVREMIAAGARSYLVKGTEAREIVAAIHDAHEGATRLSDHVADRIVAELAARLGEESRERELRGLVEQRIRSIVDEPSRLAVAYQPIVDLEHGGRTVGLEALSRFPDAHGEPGHWFADAERVGLGTALEIVAIRRAMEPIDRIPDDVYLSINTSPAALMSPGFAGLFAGLGPGRIVVEVTEHSPVDDYAGIRARLDELGSAGVRLAVDDAGAGYASLRHILKLRPDVIKLDISITRNIDREPLQRALAAALVAFARELGASIVAEGVERAAEEAALVDLGVRYGQGFLFAEPQLTLDALFDFAG